MLNNHEFHGTEELHTSQVYGSTPVHIRIWSTKSVFSIKKDSHNSEEYGFSSVCVPILCVPSEQQESHALQEYGFCPGVSFQMSYKLVG